MFFPGGGFLYLKKPERTAAYASVEAVELAALVGTVVTSGYDSADPSTEDRFNRVLLPGVWLQNTHFVGIYDAYRTARLMRGPEGYRTPVPRPGLEGLARAPFRGRQLLRPEIGLPLGALAAAGLTFSLLYDGEVTFYESQRLPLFSQVGRLLSGTV